MKTIRKILVLLCCIFIFLLFQDFTLVWSCLIWALSYAFEHDQAYIVFVDSLALVSLFLVYVSFAIILSYLFMIFIKTFYF